MSEMLLPPEGAPADYPVMLLWSDREYDAYLANGLPPSDETLERLRDRLHADGVVSSGFGVIDRSEGRINIIPAGYNPRHEQVTKAIIDLFAKDFGF
jgi:hypothetical protein